MTPPEQPGGNPGDEETSEFDRHVEKLVESRLTDERLANEWDRWSGARMRGDREVSYGWRQQVTDVFATLWNTGALQKAAAVCVIVAGVATWLMWQTGEISLRTPVGWRSATGQRLPDTLKVSLRSEKASLQDASFAQASKLGGTTRGAGGVTTHDVTFNGRTADGIHITFRGTLVLTNVPGVADIRRQRDVRGGMLSGELILGTNAPVRFEQIYLPP